MATLWNLALDFEIAFPPQNVTSSSTTLPGQPYCTRPLTTDTSLCAVVFMCCTPIRYNPSHDESLRSGHVAPAQKHLLASVTTESGAPLIELGKELRKRDICQAMLMSQCEDEEIADVVGCAAVAPGSGACGVRNALMHKRWCAAVRCRR